MRSGTQREDQRLLFGSKELEEVINGQTKKLIDYGIKNGSNIVMVARLPGGGGIQAF